MPARRRLLPVLAILLVTAAALVVVWPSEPDRYLPAGIPWPEGRGITIGDFERSEMRLGLDLQGGTRLLLHASAPEDTEFEGDALDDAVEGTMSVLRRRVDATGLAEAEITRQGDQNISVQLPGMTVEEARSLLGRTAMLQFCEPAGPNIEEVGACGPTGEWQRATGVINGEQTALTGRFLRSNAFVGFDTVGLPFVGFEFVNGGGELFGQITQRNLGSQIAIFLDEELLSAPNVSGVITDSGQITGLSLDRARELVVQLNAGALPLNLTVLSEQTVDATLGQDSVDRSVLAGQIGLLLVALFMVLYYRLPGVISVAALLVYTVITMAIFKLIPVTLTLAGIGAFVLSIGMAVDANILIFERMKEELRAGRSFAASVDAGFSRAWASIRDSNISTLITCLILFVMGGGIEVPGFGALDAPMVQGFAITLAIGVLTSLFSALVVSRAFMHLFIGTPLARRIEWWIADPPSSPPSGGASVRADAQREEVGV